MGTRAAALEPAGRRAGDEQTGREHAGQDTASGHTGHARGPPMLLPPIPPRLCLCAVAAGRTWPLWTAAGRHSRRERRSRGCGPARPGAATREHRCLHDEARRGHEGAPDESGGVWAKRSGGASPGRVCANGGAAHVRGSTCARGPTGRRAERWRKARVQPRGAASCGGAPRRRPARLPRVSLTLCSALELGME